MKTLLVLFIMGSEVRQFVHSGLFARLLEAGWRIIVMAKVVDDDLLQQLPEQVTVVPLPTPKYLFWGRVITQILDKAHADYRLRLGMSNWRYVQSLPRNWKEKILSWGIRWTGFLLSFVQILIRQGYRIEKIIYSRANHNDWDKFLTSNKVDSILVNVPKQDYWNSMFVSAEKLGIDTFLFYHTFKDLVANSRLNHVFTGIGVWNSRMKMDLLDMNPFLDPDSVQVIGCGHFDCVGRRDWLPDEYAFRRQIGALPDSLLILYPLSWPGIVPSEERYIDFVIESARDVEISINKKIQIVFRTNPMDTTPDLQDILKKKYPEHIVLRPDWYDDRKKNWCYTRISDVYLYNALLFYAGLCITIPSTVSFDCAYADLPIINMGIEVSGNQPLPGSLRAFWDVDFYKNVRDTRAAIFVASKNDLKNAMMAYLSDKTLGAEERERLLSLEFDGTKPGESSQLMFSLLSISRLCRI